MRYALVTDVHGCANHLQSVLSHIAKQPRIDEVFCLGDLFDCKVGKSRLAYFTYRDIWQVVEIDRRLIEWMPATRCIIGNQEERIRELISAEEVPSELAPYLETPKTKDLPFGRLVHGHQFVWHERDEWTWHPLWERLKEHLLFYGHNHQNRLFQVNIKGSFAYEDVPITFGKPMELDPVAYHLINVGDVRRATPSWLLYDEDTSTVTFHRLSL